MSDKLRFDYINSLPSPLVAHLAGGDEWPVIDICVETGLMRIDVVGRSQPMDIGDVIYFRDESGVEHQAETFYSDYAP